MSILTDRIFRVATRDASAELSLAELISYLLAADGDVRRFPNLAAEQRAYWWRFLVRCAARALKTLRLSTEEAAARTADELTGQVRSALLKAAPEGAWLLYQPDAKQPGFLQPPTPDGQPPSASYRENTLSLLTAGLGSKNHERKIDVGRRLPPEQVVYALVEYQMGVIFGGRGNYASQLMGSASGAGSGTPFMGVQFGRHLGETFRHDIGVLLGRWDIIRDEHGLHGDVWALWIEPWDGEKQLPAERLDPAFVPLARLVRLDAPATDGWFERVWFRATKGARVFDHTDGGNLGDPFTPLVRNPKDPAARKVRGALAKGYDYTEVVRLLFGPDATPSPSVTALRDTAGDERDDVFVVFEGMAYEQGKTLGFHRRIVPLPLRHARSLFSNPAPARAAHERMLEPAKAAKSSLRGAARILLAGSPRPREGDTDKVEGAASLLEAEIDRIYVGTLLEAAERHGRGDKSYEREWAERLSDLALDVFRRSISTIPTSTARRYEREVTAESWLRGRLSRMRGDPAADEPDAAAETTTILQEATR